MDSDYKCLAKSKQNIIITDSEQEITPESKQNILSLEQGKLMNLIIKIPDVFESILVFHNKEIENFDIGFEDFYLIEDTSFDIINTLNTIDDIDKVEDLLRKKYRISKEKPELKEHEKSKYFEKTMIQKAVDLNTGEIEERLCYKWQIMYGLESYHNPPPKNNSMKLKGLENSFNHT